MDILSLRHIMATLLLQDELKVPFQRGSDDASSDDRIRKQFRPLVENAYCVVDLMLEVGVCSLQAPGDLDRMSS